MIKIGAPVIEHADGKVFLKAWIDNEEENDKRWLWFATDEKWSRFFCDETADAFVLPFILRAVKSRQDIVVESALSEKLFFNLNTSVFYAVTRAYEAKYGKTSDKLVQIRCRNLVRTSFGAKAVGTGCSLGVDSFAVLKRHLFDEDCPPSYRVTHLTLFNAGAFGSKDPEGVTRSFYRELEKTTVLAEQLGLPFVWVDSNVRYFYPESSFDWNHTFLNMGIVLSLQKLWGKYLYASSVPVDQFEFSIGFSGHYEAYLLPHLSTESTELLSASMDMARSDKVAFIAKDKIVQEHLYVCLKEQQANNPNWKNKYSGTFLNCGRCKKCMRTMLQLEILGELDSFKDIFDMSEWPKRKKYYIAEVLANRKTNLMSRDLYASMQRTHYPIPFFSRLYACRIKGKKYYYHLKKRIRIK